MKGYPKDQDLIQQTLAGDARSFENIVERHQHAVFRLVYRLLKDRQEAEDVAQEAFLRCYQQLHRYDPSRPFTPWLYRIATNLALSRLRRRNRYRLVPWDPSNESPDSKTAGRTCEGVLGAGPEEAWEIKETKQEVLHALKSLKPIDQTVIILRYFEELSYEEIAFILRTTRNNIEVRICRARQRLRELMKTVSMEGKHRGMWEGGIKSCSPAEK
ncbi:MAG TPA: sigma-70 family RNA polymerase sigma factor [Syntrophomonadaceae bacterium]|nr:sigma-70 family RNA polymerase sigma factor [Syntrophomonadaceae bacterium]